jgi:ADP-glucose pyrophosphorylase
MTTELKKAEIAHQFDTYLSDVDMVNAFFVAKAN